jgi:hypothetical protein
MCASQLGLAPYARLILGHNASASNVLDSNSYFIALINHTRCKAYFCKFSPCHIHTPYRRPVVQSSSPYNTRLVISLVPPASKPKPNCTQRCPLLALGIVNCTHCAPDLGGPSRDLGLDGFGKVGCAFFACLSIMPHSAADLTPPRPCTVPCQRTLAPTKCGVRRSVWGSGCWILCVAMDGEARGGEMYE